MQLHSPASQRTLILRRSITKEAAVENAQARAQQCRLAHDPRMAHYYENQAELLAGAAGEDTQEIYDLAQARALSQGRLAVGSAGVAAGALASSAWVLATSGTSQALGLSLATLGVAAVAAFVFGRESNKAVEVANGVGLSFSTNAEGHRVADYGTRAPDLSTRVQA